MSLPSGRLAVASSAVGLKSSGERGEWRGGMEGRTEKERRVK